jgi:hypothetical protein
MAAAALRRAIDADYDVSGHKRAPEWSSNPAASNTAAHAEIADDDDEEEYVPLKERRAREEAKRRAKRARLGGDVAGPEEKPETSESTGFDRFVGDSSAATGPASESLFDASVRANKAVMGQDPEEVERHEEERRRREEEEELASQVARIQKPVLMSAKDHAQGVVYTEPYQTDWRPPRSYRKLSEEERNVRKASFWR